MVVKAWGLDALFGLRTESGFQLRALYEIECHEGFHLADKLLRYAPAAGTMLYVLNFLSRDQ